MTSPNTVWHSPKVAKNKRHGKQGHKSCVVWMTGLSASGKSTIAHLAEERLFSQGIRTYVLDGDNIRHGLNKDLSFTPQDRKENIRRIGEVVKLFVDAGIIVFAAFISPYEKDRSNLRRMFDKGDFIEVHVKCSIKECLTRDPKGSYKKAKKGEIPHYTGISSPYETPVNPELVLETEKLDADKCVETIISYLEKNKII